MSQLKRYACQAGKVIIGIPLCLVAVAIIVLLAGLAAELIVYLLANFLIVQLVAGGAVGLFLLASAFVVGDILFKEYNICQRFK